MSLRVAVNLSVVALLLGALAWWALANHVTFGLVTPDEDRVVLVFHTSPGVQPGFEVAYLGQAVGTVRGLELREDDVAVTVGIERDVEVPAEVDATVRRRSAVGEPYVDLTPRPDSALDGPALADGAEIGQEHTDVPISYDEVFASAGELLETLPVDALGTIVTEVGTALEGNETTLRRLQDDGVVTLSALAEQGELLDEVLADSSRLATMVADLAPDLRQGLEDTALLTGELAEEPERITRLLDRAPGLLERVNGLIVESRPQLGCLLDSLELSLGELGTDENRQQLLDAVGRSDELIAVLDDVIHERDSGPWLRTDPIFALGRDPVQRYEAPLAHPEPAAAEECEPAEDFEDPIRLGEAASASPPEPVTDDRDEGPARAGGSQDDADESTAALDSSDREVGPGGLDAIWWWALGALLVLAGAAGATQLIRRRPGR